MAGRSKAPTHEAMEAIFRNVVAAKHTIDLADGVGPEFGPPLAISESLMISSIEATTGVSRQTARKYLADYLLDPEAAIWKVYVDTRGDISSRNIPSGWQAISSTGLSKSDVHVYVRISQSGYHLPWEPLGDRLKDFMPSGDFLVLRRELDAAMTKDIALKERREQEFVDSRRALMRSFDETYPGLRKALRDVVGDSQNPKEDGYMHIGDYDEEKGPSVTMSLSGDSIARMAEALGLGVKA